MLVCLLILTLTFFSLTLYNILQANIALLPAGVSSLLSLKILDTSTAATLFVTLVGALLVRHQFALGVLPRINYKSEKQTSKNSNGIYETWRVEIRNTGLGSAIILQTEYILELRDEPNSHHSCTFTGLVKELAKMNLVIDQDYWLENIAPGFSLSPKDDCFVLEIKTEHIKKLKRLDMVLYFQGQLGDRYRREIFLIPRTILIL